MTRWGEHIAAFAFVIVAECGGKTDQGTLSPHCPTALPAPGSSCTVEGLQCEYGDDVESTCNTVATCTKGAWSFAPTDATCPTPPQSENLSSCPPTAPSGACSADGNLCNYSTASDTRFCFCIDNSPPDGGTWTWQCSSPASGCPGARPLIGSSCTQPNLTCEYDACMDVPSGLAVRCDATTSTWITTTPTTPCGGP